MGNDDHSDTNVVKACLASCVSKNHQKIATCIIFHEGADATWIA